MKNFSLFGYGNSTKALAKHIEGNVTFYDDKVNKSFKDENNFRVKNSFEFTPKYSHIEIPSPGIPPHHKLIQNAQNLISEYDFFAQTMPYSIWISGTNGKTTTTQMISHILDDKNAQAGGNIGLALGDMDSSKDIWILETSSFTLHYTNKATPNIYILLPISDDHLSWHGSFKEYEKAKLKPLQTMLEGEIVILPSKYKDIKSDAYCIYYDDAKDLADYFSYDIEKIDYKGGFLLDAIMALAVNTILYDRVDYDKINNFKLDAHRQEKIVDKKGRVWINDSKATNVDATIAALEAFEGKEIHLILGGDDKGANLRPLFQKMQHNPPQLYIIGLTPNIWIDFAKKFNISFTKVITLQNAINEIDKIHKQHSIALLSPAAASFDQFKNYQERGDQFRSLINAL